MLARVRIVAQTAERVLGLGKPKVSALRNGPFQGYSQERSIGLLNRFRCDVKIVVTPEPRSRAIWCVSVVFA